jgi:C4-dicarboxylate-specific signal transduction histidine kinase
MLLLDREARILSANRESGRLLECATSDLVGQALAAVLPDVDPEQPGRPGVCGPDGAPRSLELVRTPLSGAEEGLVLLTLLDRTRHRRMEREAAEHCAILADLSRMSMLVRLSASLAHEINQPLAAIVGNGQAALQFLAANPPALADVRDCLVDIVSNGRRASVLMRRQGSLVSGDRGERVKLALDEMVGEVLAMLRNELLNRGLWLVAEIEESLPPVTGNRVQLQQVLVTLVLKVADACGRSGRGAGLRISVGRRSEQGLSVMVAVVPGPGGEAVFEDPLAPAAGAVDPGLDLAACRVILEAHGGRLRGAGVHGRGLRLGFDLEAAGGSDAPPFPGRPVPPEAAAGQ